MPKSSINLSYALMAVIALCGVLPQLLGYINPDSAWLLSVASRVVNGEKLNIDVVETNPPLVVYINFLPAYFAKLTGLFLPHVYTAYVLLLAVASMALCFALVKETPQRLLIAFGLIFYPGTSYGEREHLMVILVLPYLISLIKNKKQSQAYIILTSVLAGVGFALKPYGVIFFAGFVLADMFSKKSKLEFLHPRHLVAGFIILIYVLYLFMIERHYVNEVLPLLLKYYSAFDKPFADILKSAFFNLVFAQIAFGVIWYKSRKSLTREIYYYSLANILGIIYVVVQHKGFTNHYYPASFFNLMLNGMLTFELWKNVRPFWHKAGLIVTTFILAIFTALAIVSNATMALNLKSKAVSEKVKLIEKYAKGKNVYVISFDMDTAYPSVMYARANYAPKYSQLWMLLGMYNNVPRLSEEVNYRKPGERIDDETRVVATVLTEIAHSAPEFVIVADRGYHTPAQGNVRFDFVKYMMQEPEFARIWQNYEEVGRSQDEIYYAYKPLEGAGELIYQPGALDFIDKPIDGMTK